MVQIAALTVIRAPRRNKVQPGDHRVAMAGLGNVSMENIEKQLSEFYADRGILQPPGNTGWLSGLDVSKKAVISSLEKLFSFVPATGRPVEVFFVVFSGSGSEEGDWVLSSNQVIGLQEILDVWTAMRAEKGTDRPQFLYIITDADHSGRWCEYAYENSYLNVAVQASCKAPDPAAPLGIFLSAWLKVQAGTLWLDQAVQTLDSFGSGPCVYIAPGCQSPLLDSPVGYETSVDKLQRIDLIGSQSEHNGMETLTRRHMEYVQAVQQFMAAPSSDIPRLLQSRHRSDDGLAAMNAADSELQIEWLHQCMHLLQLHLWNSSVAVEALRALWSLTYHEKLRLSFDEPWIAVVLAAAENHLSDVDVLISACGVLSRLAWSPSLVRTLRSHPRLGEVLKHILRLHVEDVLLSRMCCVVIYSIAENGNSSGHLDSMAQRPPQPNLHQLCFLPVLAALERHIKCPSNTSAGMSALMSLRQVEQKEPSPEKKPENQKKGVQALQHLVSGKSQEEISSSDGIVRLVACLAAAMGMHPENKDVQRQASLALSKITSNAQTCQQLVEALPQSHDAIGAVITAVCTSVVHVDLFGYEVAWQCFLCLKGMTQNTSLKWAIVSHENSKTIRSSAVAFSQNVHAPDWLISVSKFLIDVFDEFSMRRQGGEF